MSVGFMVYAGGQSRCDCIQNALRKNIPYTAMLPGTGRREAVGAAEVGLGGVVFPRITDEGGGGDLRTGEEGLCAFGDSRGVVELVIGTGELKLVDVATDELLIEGHHYLTVLVLSADGLGRERYLLAEAAAVEGT